MYKASSVIRNEGKIAKEANKKRERKEVGRHENGARVLRIAVAKQAML